MCLSEILVWWKEESKINAGGLAMEVDFWIEIRGDRSSLYIPRCPPARAHCCEASTACASLEETSHRWIRGRENFDRQRRDHGTNDTARVGLPVRAHACRQDSLSRGVAKRNDIICALTTLKLLSFLFATPVPSCQPFGTQVNLENFACSPDLSISSVCKFIYLPTLTNAWCFMRGEKKTATVKKICLKWIRKIQKSYRSPERNICSTWIQLRPPA